MVHAYTNFMIKRTIIDKIWCKNDIFSEKKENNLNKMGENYKNRIQIKEFTKFRNFPNFR